MLLNALLFTISWELLEIIKKAATQKDLTVPPAQIEAPPGEISCSPGSANQAWACLA